MGIISEQKKSDKQRSEKRIYIHIAYLNQISNVYLRNNVIAFATEKPTVGEEQVFLLSAVSKINSCFTIIWLFEYFSGVKNLVASAIGKHTDEKGKHVFSTLTHHKKFSVSAFPFFPFSKSRPSWSAHRGAPTHRGVPISRGAHLKKTKNILFILWDRRINVIYFGFNSSGLRSRFLGMGWKHYRNIL